MSQSNPHTGLPINDDDASIAAAFEDVSIPTLMLSLVHRTGDPELIRGDSLTIGLGRVNRISKTSRFARRAKNLLRT